ncbi:MAG: hypothetical protein NC086_10105 [Alistipes sp.]|nr:hypothetical protein [Alistipes sp.]
MPYQGYVDVGYYKETYKGTILPEEVLEKCLREASRHIDALTYNRIVGRGISSLTEFQQDIIRECVCKQAEFEYENEDLLKSVLAQYSINGVSMTFGDSWNMHIQSGVAVRKETYALLCQTGLCCKSLGV